MCVNIAKYYVNWSVDPNPPDLVVFALGEQLKIIHLAQSHEPSN